MRSRGRVVNVANCYNLSRSFYSVTKESIFDLLFLLQKFINYPSGSSFFLPLTKSPIPPGGCNLASSPVENSALAVENLWNLWGKFAITIRILKIVKIKDRRADQSPKNSIKSNCHSWVRKSSDEPHQLKLLFIGSDPNNSWVQFEIFLNQKPFIFDDQ